MEGCIYGLNMNGSLTLFTLISTSLVVASIAALNGISVSESVSDCWSDGAWKSVSLPESAI